jgi:hypothetical protein
MLTEFGLGCIHPVTLTVGNLDVDRKYRHEYLFFSDGVVVSSLPATRENGTMVV